MYTKQPKKVLILYILEILKKYTDEMPDEVTAKVYVNIEAMRCCAPCGNVFLKTYPQKDFLSARNQEKCAFLKDLYQNYPMLLKTEENSAP